MPGPKQPKRFKWELTETDAQALTGLLDLAVKAGGIRVSGDAARLHSSLVQAFEAAPDPAISEVAPENTVPFNGGEQ